MATFTDFVLDRAAGHTDQDVYVFLREHPSVELEEVAWPARPDGSPGTSPPHNALDPCAHWATRDELPFGSFCSGQPPMEPPWGEPAGLVPERLTYGGLDEAARRIASRLQIHSAVGEPVVLMYPSGPEFLTAFIACLYAGVIAVPAPLPGDRGHRLRRAGGIVRDSGARMVLTDRANAADVSLWLAQAGRADSLCLATDSIGLGDPAAWRPPGIRPDDIAFVQYTSGSTTDPRGVAITHRNLIANQVAMSRLLQTTPADRFGGWLPHYHDMGLVAHLLHPIWLGSSSVQMAPGTFLKQPIRWLRAIGEHGVTVGGGPNFCYELCLRRITDEQTNALDLSHWRLALNGAEPVRADTLRAFIDRFAPFGLRAETMYPCYGLAEATLAVSGSRPGSACRERKVDQAALEQGHLCPPRPREPARTLIGSGRVLDFDVKIVDPVGNCELPERQVGEIWLRGESVAHGYWRRPAETARVFGATLDGGRTCYMRTGDLGAVDGEELFVTGRLKDVIILNGRSFSPQDIEGTARGAGAELGSGVGASFTVDIGPEQLVLVHEIRTGRAISGADWEVLALLTRRIRELVSQEFRLDLRNVLLVPTGTVRRTTSGKVQRTLMRDLFLRGELSGHYEELDPGVRAVVRPRHTLLGNDLLQPLDVWGKTGPC